MAKGVTMHGFALNVNPDVDAFEQIIACGIPDVITTSMAIELGRDISITEVRETLKRHMVDALARISI